MRTTRQKVGTRRAVLVSALLFAGGVSAVGWATVASAAPQPQPYGACTPTAATVSNPAAGTVDDVMITVPAGHYYDLAEVSFAYFTANTGAAKALQLRVLDPSSAFAWSQSVTQPINNTVAYMAASNVGSISGGANETELALPVITIGPGWKVTVHATSPAATDGMSQIHVAYCDGTSASAPSVTIANPQTHVTVDNTVAVTGSFSATVTPACAAAVTTTTDPTGNADARIAPCVQPVTLDAPSDVPLFSAIGLVLLAAGVGVGWKLFRP